MLLAELDRQGLLKSRINIPVWSEVRDKAVAGRAALMKKLARLMLAYPGALLRLLREPAGSNLLLPYPAFPDIFLAWPAAKLRGHRIIFDAFISMHDTIVSDRQMVSANSLAAKLIWAAEKWALGLADTLLVDTDQHGDFFAREFGIERSRFQTVLVGAEPEFWLARSNPKPLPAGITLPDGGQPLVLFYGQLIPLHGLATILQAAELTCDEPFHWLLVGSGQEQPRLDAFMKAKPRPNVSWLPWVDYADLPSLIAKASVGLGIFGTSEKAGRVIPNKLFQMLAVGIPVITRASPAIDGLACKSDLQIKTVPAGDAEALADAVRIVANRASAHSPWVSISAEDLSPTPGIKDLLAKLEQIRVPRADG